MNDFENGKCKIAVSEEIGRLATFQLIFICESFYSTALYVRYLTAAKSLKQGELLLCEQPAVIGPYWGSGLCCLTCYRRSSRICRYISQQTQN